MYPTVFAQTQSKLPPCPSVDYSKKTHNERVAKWHNCVGRYVAELNDAHKGDVFVGEYQNGVPNGQGSYIYANGNKHVGEFKDGERNGQGTVSYANGDQFRGEFKDGKHSGLGTFISANGNKYIGELKNDKRNGQGTQTFANGSKYVGEWKDSKYDGQGIFTYSDGIVQEGIWADNQFVRAEKVNLPPVQQKIDVASNEERRKLDVDPQVLNNSTNSDFFVIQPQFDLVGRFKDGLALVRIGDDKNGKYGFVNKQGKIIIKPQFDGVGDFNDGLARVRIGDWDTGKYGFINKQGKMVINPQFDSVGDFQEELASVRIGDFKTGKYGFINKQGEFVINPQFDWANDFSEGLAAVQIGSIQNGKFGYIDKQGKIIVKAMYRYLDSFSEGLAAVRIGDGQTGKFGFIDKEGKIVIKIQFDWAEKFTEGLAAVRIGDDKTGKWGFIDKQGKIIIKPQFDAAYNFIEGLARVRIGGIESGKYGYVDKKGKIVINPQFDYSSIFFVDGLARIINYQTGEHGFIDKQGEIVINPQFSSADDFSEGFAPVCVGENLIRKCGFISKESVQSSKLATLSPKQKNTDDNKQQSSKLSLQTTTTNPDMNGNVIISVRTNADTSSLKVNGEEQGGRSDGNYSIKKVARVGQDTDYTIVATDVFGNTASTTITVARQVVSSSSNQSASLKPESIKRAASRDAVAIIIGIQNYKRVPKAEFANNDAKEFYEYAIRGLGIKPENIKLLVDEDADEVELYKAFQNWLPLQVTKNKTDVYVFYSGHGLPSPDGKSLYFLPYGVDKQFIEKTAVSQQEVIAALVASKPKSVTMFIDTCYSGQTRSGEMMIASVRPLAVKSEASVYPSNFTVISASSNDQYSSSSPELKHGIFSFFLMKGMEGDADGNKDGKITAGEMQEYLSDKVSRQAMSMSRMQDTQLVGDANKVLMGR